MKVAGRTTVFVLMIVAASCLFAARGLGHLGVEYRDDEIFYCRSTQEMLESHQWLSPTYFQEDRFQKPILFYWFVLLAYAIGGVHWFSARMVSVVFAALTAGLCGLWAREVTRLRTAALSCLILMTFPLFFRHARNVVPDMSLTFFVTLALFAGWKVLREENAGVFRIVFFVACALGFMVKGFTAILVPGLTLFLSARWLKRKDLTARMNVPLGLLIMAVIILPWFLYMRVTHGAGYLLYMIAEETKDRIFVASSIGFIPQLLKTFCAHVVFYAKVLTLYFAPWSLLALVAWSTGGRRFLAEDTDREATVFFTIWIGIVFLFFSMISFKISHYLLVLSVPLAIMTARILTAALSAEKTLTSRLIKSLLTLLMVVSALVASFLFVYLGDLSSGWLWFYAAAALGGGWVIVISRHPVVPSAVLGTLVIVIFSQTSALARAGICPMTAYQKIAAIIEKNEESYPIAVASHDLHEKELQVYFDRKIEKTGHGYELLTFRNLMAFSRKHPDAYCLITGADYRKYASKLEPFDYRVIHKERLFRKRLSLDGGFVTALWRLDRAAIQKYLIEEILLLQKDDHA